MPYCVLCCSHIHTYLCVLLDAILDAMPYTMLDIMLNVMLDFMLDAAMSATMLQAMLCAVVYPMLYVTHADPLDIGYLKAIPSTGTTDPISGINGQSSIRVPIMAVPANGDSHI